MSDGTTNYPVRTSHPSPPVSDRVKKYIYNNGSGSTEPYFMLEDGVPRSLKGTDGVNGTNGTNGIDGTNGTNGTNGVDGAQGPAGPMTVSLLVNELSSITLPNTSTLQYIVDYSFTTPAAGDSYLDIGLSLKPHSTGNDLIFDFYIDGNYIDIPYVEENKDSGTAQSLWRSMTGISLGNVSAGYHNIAIYFRKESTGGTAILKKHTLKVVRYS